jgi:ribosomal protein S18 acetylase RimI-like enzyme
MRIRLMDSGDAAAVAVLNGQLGYLAAADAMKERLAFILRTTDTVLFIAENDGAVVGWVQVLGVHFLASARSFAEIGGLVVDVNSRRRGIGRALVSEVEG